MTRFFESFGGDENFHFGLGMHQEWRHEAWDD